MSAQRGGRLGEKGSGAAYKGEERRDFEVKGCLRKRSDGEWIILNMFVRTMDSSKILRFQFFFLTSAIIL